MLPSHRSTPHDPAAWRIAKIILTLVWGLMATGVFSGASVSALTLNRSDGTWSNVSPSSTTCLKYRNTPSTSDENQIAYGEYQRCSPFFGCWDVCPDQCDTDHQSGFGFRGESGLTFAPSQVFRVGRFRHYNNPITASTTMKSVDLAIGLNFSDPTGVSATLNYTINLEETPNNGDCDYGPQYGNDCHDRVWFDDTIPDQSFIIGGVEYTLEIVGFQSSQTYNPNNPPINEFITEEDETNTAYLFGRIILAEPAIAVDKTASPTSGLVGDTIVYTYDVTNAGDLPLSNVALTDDKCDVIATPTGDDGDGVLEDGETWKYTCSYVVDPDDISGDKVVNTATATGEYEGIPVSAQDTATVTVLPFGALDVEKDVDWNGVTPVPGETFQVCIQGPSFPSAPDCQALPQGDSWIASWDDLLPGVYAISETDPGDAWEVTGDGATVTVVGGQTASHTVTNRRVQEPALTLSKAANPTASTPEGVVAYALSYENIGNVALTNVTLTDDPDEDYVASIDAISAGGVYDGDTITWSLGSLPAGASGSVSYEATLKDDTAFEVGHTPVENTATIDSDQTDPVSDDATVTVTLLAAPNLSLTKQIGTSSAGPWLDSVTVLEGADVYYHFTVANAGNVALSDVAVVDPDLDVSGCTWASLARGAAPVTCDVGPVQAEAGEHTNTAYASGLLPDETPITSDNDSASYTGLVPGLAIDKVVTPTNADPSDVVAYTLSYQNTGDAELTNVTLTDTPDWTYVASVVAGDVTYTSGSITWDLGTLAVGASDSVSYEATLKGDGAYLIDVPTHVENTATLDSDQTDSVEDDATVTVIRRGQAALSLTKSVGTTDDEDGTWQEHIAVQVGSDIYYRLVVSNDGEVALTDVSITDAKVAADACVWPAELAPGASASCILGPISAVAGGPHVNTAQATAFYPYWERTVYSNQDSASYTGLVPDVAIDKGAAPESAAPSGTVVYTLQYTNTGTMDLTAATITDTPDWTYVASAVVGDVTYTSGSITWDIGDLAAGASGSVSYEATLKDDTAFEAGHTPVENTATIDSDQTDPVSDDATVTVTLLAAPNLSLTKQIGTSSAGPWLDSVTVLEGADVYYHFTVANAGNVALSDVAVVDPDLEVSGCTWASLARGAAPVTCDARPVVRGG